MSEKDFIYISRCLELAAKAYRHASPNPMVGAVVVHNDRIIGEGYHTRYGAPHAEPMAINSVKDQNLLSQSTLYVSLEPCSHYGKTPPCAELIVQKKIKRVVIAALDPNPKVAGNGVKMLEDAGIKVEVGVLEKEARYLNRRFYTYFEKKRPFIVLKWAQTADGFIDAKREIGENGALLISSPLTRQITHKLRAENQAIMVATNTVLLDNPSLSLRYWSGRNPIRLALDKTNRISDSYKIKDQNITSYILTQEKTANKENLQYINVDGDFYNFENIVHELYQLEVQSILIEGGAMFLNNIFQLGLWDETHIEIAPFSIKDGVKAPSILNALEYSNRKVDGNRLIKYVNLK